jgi:hypothetical protein
MSLKCCQARSRRHGRDNTRRSDEEIADELERRIIARAELAGHNFTSDSETNSSIGSSNEHEAARRRNNDRRTSTNVLVEVQDDSSSGESEGSYLEGNISNFASSGEEDSSEEDEETIPSDILDHSDDGTSSEEGHDDSDEESDTYSSDSSETMEDSRPSLRTTRSTSSVPQKRHISSSSTLSESPDSVKRVTPSRFKYTCPLCIDDSEDLSTGKCGHVFCTSYVLLFLAECVGIEITIWPVALSGRSVRSMNVPSAGPEQNGITFAVFI